MLKGCTYAKKTGTQCSKKADSSIVHLTNFYLHVYYKYEDYSIYLINVCGINRNN